MSSPMNELLIAVAVGLGVAPGTQSIMSTSHFDFICNRNITFSNWGANEIMRHDDIVR